MIDKEEGITFLQRTELALKLWKERIKPEQVELDVWMGDKDLAPITEPKCGSVGCLGGWICSWPEFQELGARIKLSGRFQEHDGWSYVALVGEDGIQITSNASVGVILFGSVRQHHASAVSPMYMFDSASIDERNQYDREYDICVARLEEHIEYLTSQLDMWHPGWQESISV